jgi:hypothetical protein
VVGFVPTAAAARGEDFAAVYGAQHASEDTRSGFDAGMVANEDRSMREGFAAAYSDAHAGKDSASGMGGGMVGRADAVGRCTLCILLTHLLLV